MPSKIIAAPFVILLLIILFLTWEYDEGYSVYLIYPVIILAAIYSLSPQIDWWWYKKHPPKLEKGLVTFFERFSPFYKRLSPAEKNRFGTRVRMFIEAKDFMPQGGMPNVPTDVQAVIAAAAVQLTFDQEDYLLSDFERIVVYPKKFPSPLAPRHFHASEIFDVDGVMIFSLEQLFASFREPEKYYNIGLHEFANVFLLANPDEAYPELDESIWEKLEKISGLSYNDISNWIGLPDIAIEPVAITHYFTHREKFKQELPAIYRQYELIFKEKRQNPSANKPNQV